MSTALLALLIIAFLVREGVRRRRGADEEQLPAVLARAETAGIITASQRAGILAQAAEHGGARFRLEGAAWLGIVAGLFVVAGVSLLVAHNWEQIGPRVRIGAFLAVLAAVGEGTIRTRARSLGVNVPLETLWLFLPLLGIGLYSQTFQLTGDPIQPFLVWLALTAPLAWLSPRPVTATLHTFAMAITLFAGNFLVEPSSFVFGNGRVSGGLLALTGSPRPTAWLLSLGILAAITVQSLRLLPRSHRHHCVGIWALWLFSLLVAETPLQLEHQGWVALGAIALSTLWIVALTAMDTSFEERATAIVVWLVALYTLTFTWHLDEPADGDTTFGGVATVVVAWLAAIGGALVLPPARVSPVPGWGLAAKGLLVAPGLLALLYLVPDLQAVRVAGLLMNVVLIAVGTGLMWHGSLARAPRQINLGVLTVVGVLITRFLDVFGSMLTSGIGFIVAGVFLAGLSWALERTRRRLIERSRGAA